MLLERRAEVADLDFAVGAVEEIAGLDVAVDDPVLKSEVERPDALEDDLDHLAQREQTVHLAIALEGGARDVLHHDVAVLRLAHRVVNFDDVRVLQPTGERRFGKESLAQQLSLLLRRPVLEEKDLDRHVPVREGIAAQEDLAGRTFPDLLQNRILTDAPVELEFHCHG